MRPSRRSAGWSSSICRSSEAYAPLYASILRSAWFLGGACARGFRRASSSRAGWWCRSARCATARRASAAAISPSASRSRPAMNWKRSATSSTAWRPGCRILRHARAQGGGAHAPAQPRQPGQSRFLAAASHDLRQPLHALGLFVGATAHAQERRANAGADRSRRSGARAHERAVRRPPRHFQARFGHLDTETDRISSRRAAQAGSKRLSPGPRRKRA